MTTAEATSSSAISSATASSLIKRVVKRDGRVVDFDMQKMILGVSKALAEAGEEKQELAKEIAQEIIRQLEEEGKQKQISTEELNLFVESVLMRRHPAAAKPYLLYRHKKQEMQHQRAFILGGTSGEENVNFSTQALKILERRYLLKYPEKGTMETPKQMLQRVAKNIAQADALYDADKEEVQETGQQFYQMMADLEFLPNSPTLMNAGTKVQQLSSCVVLPIEDSMLGIFGSLKDAAIIHQRGSGTGFSFSRLRPRGDVVKESAGVAAGVVDFLRVYDAALQSIKQGGVRKGANMAVLRVDHPDIIRFIEAKRDKRSLKNFNLSVAVTDNFLRAVEQDRDYFLVNPRTEKYVGKLRAKDVFAVITQNAWKTGDPGLIFIDEINRRHPAKHLGEIETTNQCGEAPLLPYEGCVLGSLQLNKFVNAQGNDLEWDRLEKTIVTAVHFLDNVIDMNIYPQKIIEETTKKTRKFGLGMMGLADVLARLHLKYDSEEGLELADKLMSFIRQTAYEASSKLASKRGSCPAWKGSDHERAGRKMRNMCCLSLSPTGTISILADASSGCEPFYALAYHKTVMDDTELISLNKEFERVAKERGFYSPELIRAISKTGNAQGIKEVPKDVRDVFVTSQDISPEWHIKMQSTLQKYVDNSISKTINFPATASIRDVEEAYLLAWKGKCKGITIYRDGSYEDQVMMVGG